MGSKGWLNGLIVLITVCILGIGIGITLADEEDGGVPNVYNIDDAPLAPNLQANLAAMGVQEVSFVPMDPTPMTAGEYRQQAQYFMDTYSQGPNQDMDFVGRLQENLTAVSGLPPETPIAFGGADWNSPAGQQALKAIELQEKIAAKGPTALVPAVATSSGSGSLKGADYWIKQTEQTKKEIDYETKIKGELLGQATDIGKYDGKELSEKMVKSNNELARLHQERAKIETGQDVQRNRDMAVNMPINIDMDTGKTVKNDGEQTFIDYKHLATGWEISGFVPDVSPIKTPGSAAGGGGTPPEKPVAPKTPGGILGEGSHGGDWGVDPTKLATTTPTQGKDPYTSDWLRRPVEWVSGLFGSTPSPSAATGAAPATPVPTAGTGDLNTQLQVAETELAKIRDEQRAAIASPDYQNLSPSARFGVNIDPGSNIGQLKLKEEATLKTINDLKQK